MRWLFHFWNSPRPRSLTQLTTRVLSAILFGMLFGAVVSTLFTTLGLRRLPLMSEIGVTMILGAQFSLSFYFTCGLALQFLRKQVEGLPESFRRWVLALGGAIGATLGFVIATWKVAFIPEFEFAGREYVALVLVFEAMAGAVMTLVVGAFQRLRTQVQRAESEARQQEVLALRAQALALQAQIQPHFFFNTLNTISALIAADPRAAQDAVGRLADMFRYALDSAQGDLRTLEEELVFASNYLKLEQARFSTRLSVRLPDEPIDDLRLPGLTLQPLVENAVRHGIAKLVEGGTVEVAVRRNGVRCELVVSNPMEGHLDPSNLWKPGHALYNVRERLRLHDSVVTVQEKDGQVQVTIRMPMEKRP